MNLPKQLTAVTPLSKLLAMILFITLPFVGFVLGMEYERNISPVQNEEIVQLAKTPTLEVNKTNDELINTDIRIVSQAVSPDKIWLLTSLMTGENEKLLRQVILTNKENEESYILISQTGTYYFNSDWTNLTAQNWSSRSNTQYLYIVEYLPDGADIYIFSLNPENLENQHKLQPILQATKLGYLGSPIRNLHWVNDHALQWDTAGPIDPSKYTYPSYSLNIQTRMLNQLN